MSGKQKVAAVRCAGYDQELIGKQLNLLMTAIGADTLIQPGMNVLIKPNLLSAKAPEEFTTTHPEVLRALIRYVHNRGGIVTLADSPAGRFTLDSIRRVYQKTGLRALAQEEQCSLNENLTSVESGLNVLSEPVPILECVAQADLIIDCCKFKSHSYTVTSGAVKNMFGVIPGLVKAQMHARLAKRESFCRFLCQLCANVKPGLCLMDAIEGMQGNGPSGGGRRQPCAQSASSPEPDNPARILRIPDSAKGPAWDRAQNAGAALPAGKESAVSDLSSFPAV